VSDDGHLLAACGRGVHRGGHRGVLDQYPADAPAQHLRIDEEVVELTDAASALSHDREPEQLPAVADRDADPSLAIASGATPQSVGMSLEDDAILRSHPRRSPMQLAQRRPARGAPRT
jgi:hypothetical protein